MNGFDRFMWWTLPTAVIVLIAVALINDADNDAERVLIIVAAILAWVVYALHSRYLVRRRRLWRPG